MKIIPEKIKMHAHFERPYNKLKNVTFKLKILKSKLENLKKCRNLPILCQNFHFISVFDFLFSVFKFDFYFTNPFSFTLQASVSLTFIQ